MKSSCSHAYHTTSHPLEYHYYQQHVIFEFLNLHNEIAESVFTEKQYNKVIYKMICIILLKQHHKKSEATSILHSSLFMFFFLPSLKSKVFKNSLSIKLLLHTHTSSSQHGKTSITQLLRLHVGKVLGSLGLQSEGIKSNITGVVCLTKGEERTKTGFDPSSGSTSGLCDVNGKEEWEEDSSWDFEELIVGNGVVDIHSVCDGGCGLSNEVSNSGHHGNTAVHDFGLTKTLDSIDILSLGEAKRIEESKRGDGTGEAVTWLRFIRDPVVEGGDKGRGGRLGGFFVDGLGHAESSEVRSAGGRSEGRGAGNGNGEDSELHVGIVMWMLL